MGHTLSVRNMLQAIGPSLKESITWDETLNGFNEGVIQGATIYAVGSTACLEGAIKIPFVLVLLNTRISEHGQKILRNPLEGKKSILQAVLPLVVALPIGFYSEDKSAVLPRVAAIAGGRMFKMVVASPTVQRSIGPFINHVLPCSMVPREAGNDDVPQRLFRAVPYMAVIGNGASMLPIPQAEQIQIFDSILYDTAIEEASTLIADVPEPQNFLPSRLQTVTMLAGAALGAWAFPGVAGGCLGVIFLSGAGSAAGHLADRCRKAYMRRIFQ